MIIDSHAHIRSKDHMGPKHTQALVDFFGRFSPWFAPERKWQLEDFIRGPDKLINDMNRAGVDKAFLLGIYIKPTRVFVPPQYIKAAIEAYPERFYGFVSLNPIGGTKAIKELDQAVETLGMKGVGEFLPIYNGLKPNDKRIFPIYKRAEELQVPIIIHTGWTNPPRCHIEWQNPLLLDVVGEKFPELKVVMAHSGFHWHEEACMLAYKYANFHMDFAGWDIYSLEYLARSIQFGKQLGLIDRMLWGTDYVFADPLVQKERIISIPAFTKKLGIEPYVTSEDVEKILGRNAATLVS